MSLSYQEDNENQNYFLMAKIDNVKNVLQLMKAINFKDFATIVCSPSGLKVTVEDSKSVQANAFIQADMFQAMEVCSMKVESHHMCLFLQEVSNPQTELNSVVVTTTLPTIRSSTRSFSLQYDIKEDRLSFKISLCALVECLNIFGGMTALKMCYNGYGFPLTLLLEEAGVITDCSLKTQDPDDNLDFNFCNTGVVNKIITKSDCLKDIFSELDMSSEVMEILMSPDPPHFRITTFGNYGTSHFDIPRESDVVESFACTQTTRNKYKTSLMKFSIKPLAASQKVSIRTDNRGFLCLQFMIKTEDNHICFVDYFCAPEEDYED